MNRNKNGHSLPLQTTYTLNIPRNKWIVEKVAIPYWYLAEYHQYGYNFYNVFLDILVEIQLYQSVFVFAFLLYSILRLILSCTLVSI